MSCKIHLTRGYTTLVDDEDYALVAPYSWAVTGSADRSRGLYVTAAWRANGRRHTIRLHRLIMAAKPGDVVDHVNGDTLDNRRGNLRLCTVKENSRNRRPNTRQAVPLKGVVLSRGRYVAAITANGKSKYLGSFKDRYAAALAYDEAAITLFGEFASLNFSRSRDWIVCGKSIPLAPSDRGEA